MFEDYDDMFADNMETEYDDSQRLDEMQTAEDYNRWEEEQVFQDREWEDDQYEDVEYDDDTE